MAAPARPLSAPGPGRVYGQGAPSGLAGALGAARLGNGRGRLSHKVIFLSALLAPLLGACGNYAPDDVLFRAAVPKAIDVALQPPGAEVDEEGGAGAGQIQQALSSCDEAPLRCQAQQTATELNGLTGGLLGILDGIINLPPTRRQQNRRVWGPMHIDETAQGGANFTLRFELERLPAGSEHPFRYCLHVVAGQPQLPLFDPINCDIERAESGLTRVIFGELSPGDEQGATAASGAGHMVFDGNLLGQAADQNKPDLPARLDIRYDNFGESQAIDLDITDVVDENSGQFTAAAYHFLRLGTGEGDFSFKVKGDVNPEATALFGEPVLETFEITAQWAASKAGSARAAVYGGDLGNLPDGTEVRWDVEECWDNQLDTVYFRDPEPEHRDIGVVGDCLLPLPPQP